jgi:4-oxalocrotonate tautomerase
LLWSERQLQGDEIGALDVADGSVSAMGCHAHTVHVQRFKGRAAGQKRAAAAAITEAVVATLGGNAATVDVIFHGIERHAWAAGGVLWSDMAPASPAPSAP